MRVVLALFLIAISAFAQAADPTPPEPVVRLVRMMMQFVSEDGSPLGCDANRAAFGEELRGKYLVRPTTFGGISPQSAYWPEMEELHYQYHVATCADSVAMQASFALALARVVSVADAEAAVAFYSSPAGKNVMSGMRIAGKDMSKHGALTSEVRKAADDAYTSGYRELLAKYKREPK